MKRLTARIFDSRWKAEELNQVLVKAGVDSIVVAKFAVQIHPDQVQQAKEAVTNENFKRRLAKLG